MRIIKWVISLIFALILAGFAIYNRDIVPLIWNPVHTPINLPLYLIAFGFMASGFIIGGALVWINAHPVRKERSSQKRTIKSLEKKIETLDEINDNSHDVEFFPTIQSKG